MIFAIIIIIIDKVVTYIYVQYFGMFFEFYSSSAKESIIVVEVIQFICNIAD